MQEKGRGRGERVEGDVGGGRESGRTEGEVARERERVVECGE